MESVNEAELTVLIDKLETSYFLLFLVFFYKSIFWLGWFFLEANRDFFVLNPVLVILALLMDYYNSWNET